ncbi:MAG: Aspartate 1-decarboxylase PanD [Candidatus Methanohalarchaeum thermophilum]|uniref:Aspartate 1-decarboxylase n=1 Tax=Methanohalarchaeum thermophilum TaxID=1903181 RepID=A0A1Q6DSL7_METT1|nr:MAG: Aspartate 1-decarboxylase PanD [Candidatus Methanohalarchaeum thermophilum]
MKWFLNSKIHGAVVTEAELDYKGSITIDVELMEKSGLEKGEKVLVVSEDTGSRLETYVIEGERDSGNIKVNGPASKKISKGETVIIMGFKLSEEPVEATKITVDKENKFKEHI